MHRLACIALVAAAPTLAQSTITVTFTNNQPAGGFATSPVWLAAHNGTFDAFSPGTAASSALELMAELGDGSGLTRALGAAGQSVTLATQPAQPQFIPGESASATITVASPAVNRWFSFSSMIVPSNDFFIGNDDPRAHELFDAGGIFRGPLIIQIFGRQGWEARTEVNDINLGVAFLVGRDPAAGTPETGTVRALFSDPANAAYMQSMVGQETPAYRLTDVLTEGELLGTIVITPSPSTAAVIALAALGLRRRRT